MAEFALVIAQRSVHLYRLGRGEAAHVATAGGQDDPVAWVSHHLPVRADCSLVSDIMDESYVRSNLPPIWLPGTRQLLLLRRLTQQQRDTPYRAAVLSPSGSWRPPTRASLIGLGQNQRIEAWLAALAACQVRVKGLWPLSALIALAINQKVSRRPRTNPAQAADEPASLRPALGVVATSAGLRQVLVRGKIPLFSRLALSANKDGLSAAYVLTEARRTVQYLISQEWLTSAEQPVAMQMWLPFDDEQALLEVGNDPVLDVQPIEAVTDAYARLLPQLKFASAQLQFLPETSRTSWRAAQIAKTSKIVGFTALALSGLWSAELLRESSDKRDLTQQQLARTTDINQQARREVFLAKGDLSQVGLAVATVQAWQQFISTQPDQFAAMQHLASALGGFPGVEVQRIQWELPRRQAETAAPAPVARPLPFECPQANDRARATDMPRALRQPEKQAALLTLTVALPLELTQRQALQLQDRLLAGLNAGGWRAFIVKSAVSIEPAQSQAGTLGKSDVRISELCLQKAVQ